MALIFFGAFPIVLSKTDSVDYKRQANIWKNGKKSWPWGENSWFSRKIDDGYQLNNTGWNEVIWKKTNYRRIYLLYKIKHWDWVILLETFVLCQVCSFGCAVNNCMPTSCKL